MRRPVRSTRRLVGERIVLVLAREVASPFFLFPHFTRYSAEWKERRAQLFVLAYPIRS